MIKILSALKKGANKLVSKIKEFVEDGKIAATSLIDDSPKAIEIAQGLPLELASGYLRKRNTANFFSVSGLIIFLASTMYKYAIDSQYKSLQGLKGGN